MTGTHLVGISTYSFPYAYKGFPHNSVFQAEDLIDQAKELGVRCIQYGDNMPLEYLEEERLIRIGSRAKEEGILVEAGMRHMSKERLIRYLNIAR